ncbi:MAG TPA: hypothetical protein VNP72_09655, partial [Longimicrobium sp.]|nr:hypothetical protein [Longimicrobium sp.]
AGKQAETVNVYDLHEPRSYPHAQVWWDPQRGTANCTECYGALSAMSGSCAHARAVKRDRM